MEQKPNIYGTLSIWISIISIIGLFQHNKKPAIAGAIINLAVIIIIAFFFAVFIPIAMPHS